MVERVSKKHNVKPDKVIAIAMQESSYKLNAKNCYMIAGKLSCDYCMMQINDRTVKAFKFNVDKLMTNIEYCIEAGVKVLSDFKRMYGHKEKDFWTRYNSSNPEMRQIYLKKVQKYL